MSAVELIKKEEGFRAEPYYCTAGMPTIGYGRVVGKKDDPLPDITTTEEFESEFLEKEVARLEYKLSGIYPNAWSRCNEARQSVLVSMAYQLGLSGLAGFRRMWAAIGESNWHEAARQALDSKWAKVDSPNRAKRQAEQLESGLWHPYYGGNNELVKH